MSGAMMSSLGTMNLPVRNGGSIADNSSGSVQLNTNGTVTLTGGGATGTNWYVPTTANIGTNFWARATRTGGSGSTSITNAGTWWNLLALPIFAAGGAAGFSTGIIEIATDSGGVNIVGSYPISVNNTA